MVVHVPDTTVLDQIHSIPGLYISDRFSARDKALLAKHRISHILSVIRWEDLQSSGLLQDFNTAPQEITESGIQCKQVEIDDDPTEDILGHFAEMANWIRNALTRPHPHDNANPNSTEKETRICIKMEKNGSAKHTGGCVLVHCS